MSEFFDRAYNVLALVVLLIHILIFAMLVVILVYILLRYILWRNVIKLTLCWLRDRIREAVQGLMHLIGIDMSVSAYPSHLFLSRCLKHSSSEANSKIVTPRRVDGFDPLNNLFGVLPPVPALGILARAAIANQSYLTCDPKSKGENLCGALLHHLYGRLRTEATSVTLGNPRGVFDLLAECAPLARTEGLERFPANFKQIKDVAIKEILQQKPNVDALSVAQYNVMIELIKIIMVKKIHQDYDVFENQVGRKELKELLGKLYREDFSPSNEAMLQLISMSFNITIHVLQPRTRANNVYTVCREMEINAPPPLLPRMTLFEQERNSYTLIR